MEKYLILYTKNNLEQDYPYGYTNVLPPDGIDYKELVYVNGTCYSASTPTKVINILERCRKSQDYRIKLDYGDTTTGQSWGKTYDIAGYAGYVGRSTGRIKIPILVYNSRSMGGGGILDDCIVRIQLANGGTVLYEHPSYKPALL